jgi:hypothetical protein
VGAILLGIALGSVVMDEVTGISPGRRLTPERASQNVVARPRAGTPGTPGTPDAPEARIPLIVTANYDAGRTGLVYRGWLRRPTAYLRRVAGRVAIGWVAWLSIAIVWLLAVAIVRTSGAGSSTVLGAIQLPPTVALVIGLALLLEAAAAPYGPAANDNASGTAVAAALMRVLSVSSPGNVAPELVVAGAGAAGGIGIRRHLRTRRRELRRANAIVIGIAPSGGGQLHYWVSDGRLIPLRYARPLRTLASGLRNTGTHSDRGAVPHRDRGGSPAQPARARGLAAIAIGTHDPHELAPRSNQATDVQAAIDQTALDRTVEFALLLIDAINASLAPTEPSATPA